MSQVLDQSGSVLIAKLESVYELVEDERCALRELPIFPARLRSHQDIVRQGERPMRSCILLEGFTCWYSILSEGGRQITSVSVPGDIPDIQSLHLGVLDSSLLTLTECMVGFVDHDALRRLCIQHPNLGSAFWKTTLIESAVFRQWVTNVGGRSAYKRVAHLLCEIMIRMKAIGMATNNSCEFPITQAELGDATGLSNVHINRTLQQLRSDHLISLKDRTLYVHNWQALQDAGDFDPGYLHLREPETSSLR